MQVAQVHYLLRVFEAEVLQEVLLVEVLVATVY
jgi:hypothetical protein